MVHSALALGGLVLLAATLGPLEQVRPSILILGDDGFLHPGSGVRAGTGTPDDPSVIADWTVAATIGSGVRLVGTSAHVVLRDLTILPFVGATAPPQCVVDTLQRGACHGGEGVRLDGATNVRMERIRVLGAPDAVAIHDGGDVVIDGLEVAAEAEASRWLYVASARDLHVRNAHVRETFFGATVRDVDHLLLESIDARGATGGLALVNVDRATLRGSTISDQPVFLDGDGWFRAEHNAFTGRRPALWTDHRRTPELFVCGNTFRMGPETRPVEVRFSNATFHGNEFGPGSGPISIQALTLGDRLRFEGNRVGAASDELATGLFAARSVILKGNSFPLGPPIRVAAWQGPPVDARENWWGDASGPGAPAGTGAGVGFSVDENVALVQPWLTEDPRPPLAC